MVTLFEFLISNAGKGFSAPGAEGLAAESLGSCCEAGDCVAVKELKLSYHNGYT